MYLKLSDGTLVGRYSPTGKSNFSVLTTKSYTTDLDGVTTGTGKVKVSASSSSACNCLLETTLTATFSIVAPEADGDDGDDETSDAYKKLYVSKNGSGATKHVAKKITVNAKTGKVTLKKGLAKGTYRVVVKVRAAATSKYKAASKVVTAKVKVK